MNGKASCCSYETIEKNLIPVGISGIEDLLQDDVYETISVFSLYVSSQSFHLS